MKDYLLVDYNQNFHFICIYLRDLEFTSSGNTVITSSNGHKLAVDPPNL